MFSKLLTNRVGVIAAVIGVLVLTGRAEEDPFSNLDPDASPIVAQASAPSAGAASDETVRANSKQCRCLGEFESANATRIKKALRAPLTDAGFDFTDTTLGDVVELLQQEYAIPIQLDEPALEATGLDSTEPVTIKLRNVSLQSALGRMLERLQLTYIIQDEVLLITTPEEAESQLLTCVYDVRNLVEKPPEPKGASAWADYDPLIGAITECIAPDTWQENGKGEGNLRSIGPGFLVVYQTRAVHEQIASLLTNLRELRQSPPPVAHKAATKP